MGRVRRRLRQWDAATAHHSHDLALSETAGDDAGRSRALSDLGETAEAAGETARAEEMFVRALQAAKEAEDDKAKTKALANLGKICRHGPIGRPFFKRYLLSY